jgi:preprotein translocase subunit SecF
VELVKPGRQFDFMSKRRYFIGASFVLLVLSVLALWKPGLRLGTDFKGGTEVEIAFTGPVSAGDVREAAHRAGFEAPDVVSVADPANPNRFLIRVQEVSALTEGQKAAVRARLCAFAEDVPVPEDRCPPPLRAIEVRVSPGGDKISARYEVAPDLAGIARQLAGLEGVALRAGEDNPRVASQRDHKVDVYLQSKGDQLMDGLRKELGPDKVPARALRVEWIGPKAGAQLRDAAFKSVAIAIVFIMAYVGFRFDMRFAPGGIVALVHDVGIAMGAMAITQREITISTVAAMLTIVGYSINDTVIVYDRIRENLARHRELSFSAVINLSISEMLGRTIITSGVTALSLVTFLVWGTGMIKDFAFALLVGIVVGTYSSIYIAAPLTEWIDHRFFAGQASRRKKVSRVRAKKRETAVV